MTAGLDGRIVEYDGENRPLGVAHAGLKTCYVYGAGGARLMKIEGIPPAIACPTPTTVPPGATVYFGPVELRGFDTPGEQVVTYPHPSVRLVNGVASFLHRDALSSVRAVTGAGGGVAETAVYRPYGEQQEWALDASAAGEDKGFIGERFDADAGLQYLNARYYDPKLGLFLQPDWFEVTEPGVGTNRYAYCAGDPINCADPNGNFGLAGAVIGGLIGGLVQLGLDLADGRLNSPRSDYIGAIAGGAFVGATGGLGGGSALSLMAAGAGGGAFGEATRALAAGERLSPSRIGTAAVLGGALSFPGARLIAQRSAALSSNAVSRQVKGALGEQVVRRQYAAMGYFSTGTRVVKLPKAPRTPTGRTRQAEIDFDMRLLGIGPRRGVEAKFGTAHLTFNQRLAMHVDPFTVARVSPLDAAGLGFSVPGVAPLSFGSVIGGSIAAAPAYEPLRLTITPGG